MKTETGIQKEYIHIDNGGITLSFEDKGKNEGIHFKMEATYFGYPSVSSSIRVEHNLADFVEAMENLLKKFKAELPQVDWSARYE